MAFSKGQVVVRKGLGHTVHGESSQTVEDQLKGRICRVVTPGLTYKVFYEGFDRCLLQFEKSLLLSTEPGPECPPHRTC